MYEIPSLTYKYYDLEPFIDEATMQVHYTKHHQTYADKINVALEKYPVLQDKDLTTLIRQAERMLPEDIRTTIINNGGGFLNHSFWSDDSKKLNLISSFRAASISEASFSIHHSK